MLFGCSQFARRIYKHFRLLKQAFRIFMIVSRSWLFSNPVKFVSDDGDVCMYMCWMVDVHMYGGPKGCAMR